MALVEQLGVKRFVDEKDWDEFYMGDDGAFTFYIDMVKGEFSKNSKNFSFKTQKSWP